MSNDELTLGEASPEELEEAAALARALDRGQGSDVPTDALETAALLRFSAGEDLDEVRGQAILGELIERAPVLQQRAERRFRLGVWGAIASALAAAGLVLFVGRDLTAPSTARLPTPPRELLEAQTRAAGADSPEARLALAASMSAYRREVLRRLREGGR